MLIFEDCPIYVELVSFYRHDIHANRDALLQKYIYTQIELTKSKKSHHSINILEQNVIRDINIFLNSSEQILSSIGYGLTNLDKTKAKTTDPSHVFLSIEGEGYERPMSRHIPVTCVNYIDIVANMRKRGVAPTGF